MRTLKGNKYGAKVVWIDNIRFASQMEATRYTQLKLLYQSGEVAQFEVQPRFELAPGIAYIADFRVFWANGKITVEDVKGVITAVFRLKKKLFEAKYGPLTVITHKDLRRAYVPE